MPHEIRIPFIERLPGYTSVFALEYDPNSGRIKLELTGEKSTMRRLESQLNQGPFNLLIDGVPHRIVDNYSKTQSTRLDGTELICEGVARRMPKQGPTPAASTAQAPSPDSPAAAAARPASGPAV